MNELADWLARFGLEDVEPLLRENDVDLDILQDLDESDFEKLGLSLGRRKRLLRAIASLSPGPAVGAGRETGIGSRPEAAERRQITVMFCDLVGSTALSTQIDPEELRDLLRRYRDVADAVVRRFRGYVARFSGDGILIYFGYPQAHEYDAERAVRAALQIVEAVARLDTEPRINLQVRIGIATGLVVVGDIIGTQQSEERAVVGETPNLAARLQGLAEPNEVVVSPSTRALAGAAFRYRNMGHHRLKGIAEPMQVWGVEDTTDALTRFEAIHGSSASPLVDRDGEIDWLRACWSQCLEHRGQVILIAGEAGFGKSRLVHAFSKELQGAGCERLHLQCSPYHDNSAYFPIITALSQAAGFASDDSGELRLAKLRRLIASWSGDEAIVLEPLAQLLAPTEVSTEETTKSRERIKQDAFEALTSLLLGLCANQPLLLVVEDMHWIDPTTWEFLELLSPTLATQRVTMVVTFRPDSQRTLERHPHVSTLELTRLSGDSASAVVTSLLGGKSLPEALRQQILDKTDGVPLFIEELTKMILETDLLRDAGDHYELTEDLPELSIPATLHESLMARLDRLEPVKEVAQVGAVIGREFDYELLARVVVNIDEAALHVALDRLADAELVYASGRPPRAVYTFKHALVQDAAYASMLNTKRRSLHARVAEVLETQFRERVFQEPELMARHCEHGGLTERAVESWSGAAQRALERSAIAETLAHVGRGRNLLPKLADSPVRQQLALSLENLRGWASIAAFGYTAPQTGEAFDRARALCDSVDGSPHLFPVLHGQWLYYLLHAQVGVASSIAGELMKEAVRRGDPESLTTAHRVQGTSAFWLGDFEEARSHLQRALARCETYRHAPADATSMFDVRVLSLDFLSLTLLPLGQLHSALEHGERALAAAQDSGALVTLAVLLQHGCLLHQLAGNRDEVQKLARQLAHLAERERYPFWQAHAHVFEAWARLEHPDKEAVERLAHARELAGETGAQLFSPYYAALLGGLCGRAGQGERAAELFDLALERIEATQERWFEAEVFRMRGELRASTAGPATDAALKDLRDAMAVARRQGAALWELRAGTSLARLLARDGDPAAARRILEPLCQADATARSPDLTDAQALLETLAG